MSFKRSDDLDPFLYTSSEVLDWGGCKWLSDKLLSSLIELLLGGLVVTIANLLVCRPKSSGFL